MNARTMHRLTVNLVFPEGLSPGESREGNLLSVAKDGSGRPVLRGSSLAGALRHAWTRRFGIEQYPDDENPAREWFGAKAEEKDRWPSALQVPDVPLDAGRNFMEHVRTHNAINRHRGSVLDHSLFSLQALPPGTCGTATLWLKGVPAKEIGEKFLTELTQLLDEGLTLGGKAARGLGRVMLTPETRPVLQSYDLSTPGGMQSWLNDSYLLRQNKAPETEGTKVLPQSPENADVFLLTLTLGIPAAEDLLLGDGQGLEYEMEPQQVKDKNGTCCWRIPGSSLRGVFRAWFNRLAAIDGLEVFDSFSRFGEQSATGAQLAWLGLDQDKSARQAKIKALARDRGALPDEIACPVARLFGNAFHKGRLHISDALTPVGDTKAQPRMHVAVDRFTGGASEGFLFDNTVLTHGPAFTFHLRIESPEEQEIRWLLATLRALHHGILRVGSSKAGGRLGVFHSEATGKYATLIPTPITEIQS